MNQKKLCKSTRNRKIAGVCGGISEYLNIDSTLIRLAFALISIFWCTGIIIYIVCALVMPDDTEILQ